jgi:hypothetical protein
MSITRLQILVADFILYLLQQQELITLDYVIFVASEKVIICTLYCTAVPLTGLDTYLRTCYYISPKLRRITIVRFDGVPAAQTLNNLVPR